MTSDNIATRPRLRRAKTLSLPDKATVLEPLQAMADVGYREVDRMSVRLALEEALINAYKHGSRCDPRKQIYLGYSISDYRVLITVRDQGKGFDPARVPDPRTAENLEKPSGRGLLLMRSFMTWLQFNRRGNEVTMCKYRSRA